MKIAIVIPARIGSTRFPNKPLAKINGKEMVLHVCDRLESMKGIADIMVATDCTNIKSVVENKGHKAIMTDVNCETGTDRIYQATKDLDYDIIINVQGDEPLVNTFDVKLVLEYKKMFMEHIIGTIAHIDDMRDIYNPNIVKYNYNIGLTRKPVCTKFKQCGLYAFTKQQLKEFTKSEKTETEGIELTRKTNNKIKFIVIQGSPSVDSPDDIKIIEKAINKA